jgi:hypothetical protein
VDCGDLLPDCASGNRRNPLQRHVCLLVTEIGVGFRQCLHGAVGHELIRELVIEAELALDVPAPAEDLALRHEGQTVAATGLQYSASAPSSNRLDPSFFPPFTAAAVDLSPRRR